VLAQHRQSNRERNSLYSFFPILFVVDSAPADAPRFIHAQRQRFAPCLESEFHQRVDDAAFGAAQAQTRGILHHLPLEAAVLELTSTAARTWIVTAWALPDIAGHSTITLVRR
jgi:hypothetical protein